MIDSSNVPVLRLELDSMRERVLHAYMSRSGEIGEMVEKALEEALTPEKLEQQIRAEVAVHTKAAVAEQIKRFFQYGDGHKYVKNVVDAALKSELLLQGEEK